MGVRKTLGVAAWLVLGVKTKDTKAIVKPASKKPVPQKVASKPGRVSNYILKIFNPFPPKNAEVKVQSEKGLDQTQESQVAVAEPKVISPEKIAGLAEKNIPLPVGLKLEVKEFPQVSGGVQPVIPVPISLEEVIKNEGIAKNPALSTEEVDLGPEPVVKKIENLADIPKKPNDIKTEVVAEAHDVKVEISSDKSLFESKPGEIVKAKEKEEEKAKEEAPPTVDIQETLSKMFAEGIDEEVSSLEDLIASLPDVPIDEILNEIKDVESLLGEYVKAK